MKKVVMSVVAALAVAAPAYAADMPVKAVKVAPAPAVPVWDLAFGASVASDYNFRGISQSDRGPSVSAYFEPRFNINPNLQLYSGIAGSSVKLATDPAAEVDFYAGIRPTFGALALDFGGIYYWYPSETQFCGGVGVCGGSPGYANGNTTIADTDFWEVYAKAAWTFNPTLTVGANLYYSPSWLNTGASGTYASATAKVTLPTFVAPTEIGWFLSGEFGHYWLGKTDAVAGVFIANDGFSGWELPDYNYWNLGVGFTWKALTLDLRYHDTDLSKAECNALTADPGGAAGVTVINNFTTTATSKWCNATFIAKLSVDFTLAGLR